jgi:hypothetical protein
LIGSTNTLSGGPAVPRQQGNRQWRPRASALPFRTACPPAVPPPQLDCGVSSDLPSPPLHRTTAPLGVCAGSLGSAAASVRTPPASDLRGVSTSSRDRKGRGPSETP